MSVSTAHPAPRVMPPGFGNRAAPTQSPLLDVLGAAWTMDAAVVGVAWDRDGACFALADGSLAMGRAEWDGAPRVGPRDGGGMELTPGSAPPPPVTRLRVHDGACLSVAKDFEGGFLSGGEDGVFAHTADDGTTTVLERFAGAWVDLVAAGSVSRACATGRNVRVSGAASAAFELPGAATAMVFDHSGRKLAVAGHRALTLWQEGDAPRTLPVPGLPRALAWSFDGHFVVCGMQERALYAIRVANGEGSDWGGTEGQPRSLSFAASGAFVAASGGPRVTCWPLDGGEPSACGLSSSRTPVSRVACHPTRTLIAAGYHNGAVMLCQPGADDVLFVRASSAGRPGTEPGVVPPRSSVVALAWSADGARLAIGTEGGEIALIPLPDKMFRFGPVPAPDRRLP